MEIVWYGKRPEEMETEELQDWMKKIEEDIEFQKTQKLTFPQQAEYKKQVEKLEYIKKELEQRMEKNTEDKREEEYIYSKKDILQDLNIKEGTFYNRIRELEIMDNPMYMKKVKEKNRDKTYFNQKAYDKIRECQNTLKSEENNSNEYIDNTSSNILDVESISIQVHNEITFILKQQLEDYRKQLEEKDKQIATLQNIIGVKEQTTLVEKQKQIGTAEDNKKWWHFWKKK